MALSNSAGWRSLQHVKASPCLTFADCSKPPWPIRKCRHACLQHAKACISRQCLHALCRLPDQGAGMSTLQHSRSRFSPLCGPMHGDKWPEMLERGACWVLFGGEALDRGATGSEFLICHLRIALTCHRRGPHIFVGINVTSSQLVGARTCRGRAAACCRSPQGRLCALSQPGECCLQQLRLELQRSLYQALPWQGSSAA